MAIVVGWYKCGLRGELVQIRWLGYTRVEEIGTKYLELASPVK
jgi:predicted DNA-binding transcriptional regulator